MVSRCRTFADEANKRLEQAVNEAKDELTTPSYSPQVFFAKPEFGARNAIFAPDPWVWGIGADLSPADEEQMGGVRHARAVACHSVQYQDPDRTDLFTCIRASMGHPNVKGAQEYARVIGPFLQP